MVSETNKNRLILVGLTTLHIVVVFAIVCACILAFMGLIAWAMWTMNLGPFPFIFGFCAPVMTAIILAISWLDV